VSTDLSLIRSKPRAALLWQAAALTAVITAAWWYGPPLRLMIQIAAGAVLWAVIFVLFPRSGLILMIIELVIGGSGHLLTLPGGIALRHALFASVVTGWIFRRAFRLDRPARERGWEHPALLLLAVAIVIGFGRGLIQGNAGVYTDTITWAYLLLIPIFDSYLRTAGDLVELVRVAVAACLAMAIAQIAIFFLLSLGIVGLANLPTDFLRLLNIHFTSMGGSFTRVFTAGVIFYPIALTWFLLDRSDRHPVLRWAAVVTIGATFIIALTRGLWVGIAAGLLFWGVIGFGRVRLRRVLVATAIVVGVIGIGVVVFWQQIGTELLDKLVAFYHPLQDESTAYKLEETLVLLQSWFRHPVLGQGFGEVAGAGILGGRLYFHNSYLAFLLKTGGLGFTALMLFLAALLGRLRSTSLAVPDARNLQVLGSLTVGVVCMLTVSLTNPYIGSPMGLVMIGLLVAITRLHGSSGPEAALDITAPDTGTHDGADK